MNTNRRIVSLHLPRLPAERLARRRNSDAPFAVVEPVDGALRIVALDRAAEAMGLRRDMGLTDARAMAPALDTAPADRERDAILLAALARWAGRYSPWVAVEGRRALAIDATGCVHLFGGEATMLEDMLRRLADLGFEARAAIADTRGAAWALARYAPLGPGPGRVAGRDGDAISQDARATRVRSPRRKRWEKPAAATPGPAARPVIAPAGGTRAALAALPVAALRLEPKAAAGLARLGLATVDDLARLPRGALARRFGRDVVRRLDQAMGAEPEPVSPLGRAPTFAARLTLPEPVGLEADVLAAARRLLDAVCARLEDAGMGARALRLTARRVDGAADRREIRLARPGRDPERLIDLFRRPVGEIDAGFGIDAFRLEAITVEPLRPAPHKGWAAAQEEAAARLAPGGGAAFADLLSRIGGRIGLDRVQRLQPADSHIPEKSFTIVQAAYSEPAAHWPPAPRPRPLILFPPEPLAGPAGDDPAAPRAFRWRGRDHDAAAAAGPERIAPEWWLDDPAWRSGPRDYWRVETTRGERIWLFHAKGGEMRGGWFAQGLFA